MFLLLGIFAITISVHTTYAQTGEVKDDHQSYENDEIGVNLEYPADWSLIDGIPNVNFVARFWAPGASGLISMDHVYRDTKISPEEIGESHVKRLENRGDVLTSVESKPLLISGYPAWQLTYSGITHELRPYTLSKVFVTADDSRYVFLYHGGQRSEYLAIFNSIIDSVQISPTDADNLPDGSSDVFSSVYVPDWVEHNARWWNGGQIDDQTMISAIQFLADREIIIMPSMKEIDVYKIAYGDDPHLYDTIKHNAWVWAEEDEGEQYFLKGIGYLASLNSQDESSSNSKNPEDCPQSFSSRCFAGKITEVVDGDTTQVNDIEIHLALISTPQLGEEGWKGAKEVVERYCPDGTDALVDRDSVHQLDVFTDEVRVLAVVYCNGYNINEILLQRELGSFDNTYCHASEFADESWAREGCSE